MIPRDTHDGAFYRAVLALHQDLFSLAQQVSYGSAENAHSPPHPHPAVYINWCIFLQKTHIDVLLSFHDCSQSLESSLVNLKQAKKNIQKHWKRTLIELYKMALRLFQTGFYYPTRLWNRNKSQTDSFGVFSFFLPPMYSMIAPRC